MKQLVETAKFDVRSPIFEVRNSKFDVRYSMYGFTLMEVLVALAIMGIAVTYVIQLFSVNLGSISASDSHVAAVMRAESKMRQLLDEVPADEKSWSEVTDDGYRMDLTVSDVLPERTENLHVKLIEIDLTLHWQQGSKEKALTLSTLKIVDKL